MRQGPHPGARRAVRDGHRSLREPGYKPSGLRAKNLSTIDEVPDSSWFTNRVGVRTLTIDEIVRGRCRATAGSIALGHLPGKDLRRPSGRDCEGRKRRDLVLEFDPSYYPDGATAAVVMATKFFWALGYTRSNRS